MLDKMLTLDCIKLDLKGTNKSEIIDEMIDVLDKAGKLNSREEYKKAILAREEQSSTGLEEGIAIPHAKTSAVKVPSIAFGLSNSGVDYNSLDGEPSKLFFMIAAPANASDTHIEVLSQLTVLLLDDDVRERLLDVKSKEEVLEILMADKKEEVEINQDSEFPKVLAVTACPTGIAHTYMAADALKKKAQEMGVSIKIETNGSTGIKNPLTKEEIDNALGIIVAADKNVEMARFDGKKVIQTKVANGIHKAEELITKAMNGEAPVFQYVGNDKNETTNSEEESIGRQIYKHLMSGVSHMLPFVIGGGILIALAFLLDDYSINPSNFGANTPLAALLKTIGGTAFGFMLPVLAGYIAMSIADRPGLAVGVVGGMLANLGITYQSAFDSSISVVSGGFLGALFAGFVGGYLVLGLKKIFDKLPQSLDGLKPTLLYPFFGIGLIGIIMIFVNPFFGQINTVITNFLNTMGGTSKILLGLVLGGMMAIDMGGPFNKAAYVFGTASLTTGNTEIMAAVMAGGMVPPLGIALATTFFKNKFTKSEKSAGKVCYVMGLSFITEGAIPFAAADPIRVIPTCVIGSAVAGGLSMLFGAQLPAPHGGVFVFPVVTNPMMYLLAILIGSIVTGLILGIVKKTIKE